MNFPPRCYFCVLLLCWFSGSRRDKEKAPGSWPAGLATSASTVLRLMEVLQGGHTLVGRLSSCVMMVTLVNIWVTRWNSVTHQDQRSHTLNSPGFSTMTWEINTCNTQTYTHAHISLQQLHINLQCCSLHLNWLLLQLHYLPTECQTERSKQAITLSKFTSRHSGCMVANKRSEATRREGKHRDVTKKSGSSSLKTTVINSLTLLHWFHCVTVKSGRTVYVVCGISRWGWRHIPQIIKAENNKSRKVKSYLSNSWALNIPWCPHHTVYGSTPVIWHFHCGAKCNRAVSGAFTWSDLTL